MMYRNAARQIRILRAENDLTQSELAEALDVNQKYISAVETGNRKASLYFYINVANYFKVTLDYLFSDSIKAKKNIIIDSVAFKMDYMNEEEQRYVLSVIEAFSKYIEKDKEQ